MNVLVSYWDGNNNKIVEQPVGGILNDADNFCYDNFGKDKTAGVWVDFLKKKKDLEECDKEPYKNLVGDGSKWDLAMGGWSVAATVFTVAAIVFGIGSNPLFFFFLIGALISVLGIRSAVSKVNLYNKMQRLAINMLELKHQIEKPKLNQRVENLEKIIGCQTTIAQTQQPNTTVSAIYERLLVPNYGKILKLSPIGSYEPIADAIPFGNGTYRYLPAPKYNNVIKINVINNKKQSD